MPPHYSFAAGFSVTFSAARMVNSADGFGEQPAVINGFSDLMVSVFGEKGKHARSAVGATSLPLNIAVEVEMIVEVE